METEQTQILGSIEADEVRAEAAERERDEWKAAALAEDERRVEADRRVAELGLLEQTIADPEAAAYAAIEVAKGEPAGSVSERLMLDLAQVYAILALVDKVGDLSDRLVFVLGGRK